MNRDRIISHFGGEFYEKVLGDLEKYAELWELSGFEQIDYYSINCMFKCVSARHGLCVLKIGKDSKEAKNELSILREYEGTRFCRVYESDVHNGVLLLERIVPGARLRDVPSLDERLELFCELYRGLHRAPKDTTIYPAYTGWVSRIAAYMRERGGYELLSEKMTLAETVCRELCKTYKGEMLLHGDFHHDNILTGADGGYRIIDPKGVVGDPVFDIPRFILNEFDDDVTTVAFREKYDHITRALAEKLNVPERDIRRLTFVETCMSQCWDVEDGGEPKMEQVLFTESF